MGFISDIFQNSLKAAMAEKGSAREAVSSIIEKSIIDSKWPKKDHEDFMAFTKGALSKPGAEEFFSRMARDEKFVEAFLEFAQPKYGITMMKLPDSVLKLFVDIAGNLKEGGFAPFNKALEDPKQREALLKALKSGDRDQVFAFTRGEAPIQMATAKNEGGQINLGPHFKEAVLAMSTERGDPSKEVEKTHSLVKLYSQPEA